MPTQKETNTSIADYGLKEIAKVFPLGGINRVDVFKELEDSIAITQFLLFATLRSSYDMSEEELITSAIITSGKLKGAFCSELAIVTKKLLERQYPGVRIELVDLYDHQMLVIGRASDSDSTDITTWGDDAIICDPWARKVYEASSFASVKKEKIPFYTNFFPDPIRGKVIVSDRDIETNYLSGKPIISGCS